MKKLQNMPDIPDNIRSVSESCEFGYTTVSGSTKDALMVGAVPVQEQVEQSHGAPPEMYVPSSVEHHG